MVKKSDGPLVKKTSVAPVAPKSPVKKPTKKANKKPAVQASKSKPKKRPVGRPRAYNEEVATKILSYLAIGESMRTVCKRPGMPAMSTVFKWLREYPEFTEQYARAKEEAADVLIEDILDIADDGTNDFVPKRNKDGEIVGLMVDKEAIQRSRVRIDTRKWLASKLKPKKYGDRIAVDAKNEHSGMVAHNHTYEDLTDEELVDRAKKLMNSIEVDK